MVHVLCSESKSVDQLCSDLICTYAKDRLSCGVARMSHVTRKPVFGVSDQVRHKLITGLYSHRIWLETVHIGLRKNRNCTIYVVKT